MRKILLGLGLALILSVSAQAQSNFIIPVLKPNAFGYTIFGIGATVTLNCTSGCGASMYSSITDANGNAQFSNVVTGNYSVTTSGPGIQNYVYNLTVGAVSFVGAVSNVSCAGLTNYFNCAVANPGTTPAISFTPATSGPVIDCSAVAGADMGAKLNTCYGLGPAAGAVYDATHFTSPQTISTAVTQSVAGVTQLCGLAINQTANININNGKASWSGCPGNAPVLTKGANIDQITNGGLVQYLTLVGVGGTFTGRGIVNTLSSSVAQYNNVSGEAGDQFAGVGLIQSNVATASLAGHAISTTGAIVSENIANSSHSDAIFVTSGTSSTVIGNIVGLSPAAGSTGLCGINFNGDLLDERETNDVITINDGTGSGNVDYGLCDTPTTGHNLNNLFSGTVVIGQNAGGITSYAFFLNNAAGVNTNWGVQFVSGSCVHLTACIKAVDPVSNVTTFLNIQPGDAPFFDGTTTDTNVQFISDVYSTTFSGLAALGASGTVGNASRIFCRDCTGGLVTSGGPGTFIERINNQWYGQVTTPNYTFVQNTFQQASATSVAKAFPSRNVSGDFIVVAVNCTNGSATPPTLTVSDTLNGSYASAIAINSIPGGTTWGQIFFISAIAGGTANTVTASSSGVTCTSIQEQFAEYGYLPHGILATSPEDGAGSSASATGTVISSGNYAASIGDLSVGFSVCPATGTIGGYTNTRSNSAGMILMDQIVASSPQNVSASCSSGGNLGMGVAFKPQ